MKNFEFFRSYGMQLSAIDRHSGFHAHSKSKDSCFIMIFKA